LVSRSTLSNFNPHSPPTPSPRDWRAPATTAIATALLALFWWLAVSASLEKSQTSDEMPHIGSGYVYDRFGDFRMQPENGNLPQRIFGLPALATHARFPLDEARWRQSKFWELSWDFLYAENNLTDWLLLGARALNACFGVALGALIFGLARTAHGRAGGLIALGFYTFAPNFLAHAALATSDLAGTLFLTLAAWLFWRHLQRRDLASGALAGIASGLALVAKHNGILLAPIYLLLVVADAGLARTETATESDRQSFLMRLASGAGLAVVQAGAAVFTIWAFYHFRFEAGAPGLPKLVQFAAPWDELYVRLGAKRNLLETALKWKILPEAWLYGLTHVLAGATQRLSFFAGEHSLKGWWQFFPTLFLTKTTLAMLGALGLVLAAALRNFFRTDWPTRRCWLRHYAPLLASASVVWSAAITSTINVGDRHILPVYPVLFVALGMLASQRGLMLAAVLLLSGHAWSSCSIRPHYLAAFNALAGGPENAHRLAVDSSLDWGQDLPALQKWLASHRGGAEPFYLGYFGNAWPPHYGVRPTAFLTTTSFVVGPPLIRYDLRPGIYALSATVLAETYSPHRGPWTVQYEEDYRTLRARFEPVDAGGSADGGVDYARYDSLRLARLCKYLQRRQPDAYAGYSILIFRLNPEELRAALDGPVVALHRLRLP
jgi:hypothetical protein